MNKYIVTLVLLAAGYYFFAMKKNMPPAPLAQKPASRARIVEQKRGSKNPTIEVSPGPTVAVAVAAQMPHTLQATHEAGPKDHGKKPLVLPYVLDGELAVVQGDIVVGAIVKEDTPPQGRANVPELRLWPSGVIPYYIQPNFSSPDRVKAAFAYFSETNIQFVPFTDQEDALIFEEGTGVCKSYVGRMGGKQPIFLPALCGPHEIAHEILHALGFIHEQNRDDRDGFIQVNFDNIDDKYRDNFEKLPPDFMKVSGLSSFDFESLMIYPPAMFAKGSQPTMQPLDKYKPIRPGHGLSRGDVERVNRAYP